MGGRGQASIPPVSAFARRRQTMLHPDSRHLGEEAPLHRRYHWQVPKRADSATEPLFAEGAESDAPLAARMRPRTLDEFVGQESPGRPRGRPDSKVVQPGLRAEHGALGAAWLRQDDAGTAAGGPIRRHLAPDLGGDERRRRHPGAGGRRQGAAPGRRADGGLHRRAASVQQEPAGRAAAARRGRHHRPDRGDHREPVLRDQLAPPVTAARLPARAAGSG